MHERSLLVCIALLVWGVVTPAAALELSLPPNAVMAREVKGDGRSYALPIGPWASGSVPVQNVAGDVTRQAWRIDGSTATTLQLMNELAAQLDAAGYDTLFRCEDATCGGFDFRFAIPVLPPPEMFVDLFDYRFLSASRGEGSGADHVSLLLSRSGAASYLQVTQIAADDAKTGTTAQVRPAPPVATQDAIVSALQARGRVVLSDLDFGTAAAALGEGQFASLTALAGYLKADSRRRIALVGHTDTVGGYDANLALSRRRARAVMDRLVRAHGVPTAQLEAEGIAYLAPRAPNSSAEGREANRRVEAVLLSGN
ncbi:OmpA family protein [Roseovarius sp. Pro17]|uniref:OmpA family protein n=1 Tax=Roseovarius sp. Pro17 TaxID=3108175 RepID=UPI002D782B06|nr:OmpA family protein [Roseovarius sp. Pro17]